VDPESTTTICSLQPADRTARTMFGASSRARMIVVTGTVPGAGHAVPTLGAVVP
jgi:hypothetical protein